MGDVMFQRILVPTDGSGPMAEVLDAAAEVARRFGASIDVLCVVDTYADVYVSEIRVDFREALLSWGRQNLEEAAKRLKGREGVRFAVHLREDHPAEGILRFARENRTDLIVMGTVGRRGIKRLLLGSVAEEVIRRAEAPVLAVRASAAAKGKPAAAGRGRGGK